jgi:hypothetical protein
MVCDLPFAGSLGCNPKSAKGEPEEGKALNRKEKVHTAGEVVLDARARHATDPGCKQE